MDFAFGKDWIFGVHQFVEQDADGVGVVDGVSGVWVVFEAAVIKIGHICSLGELLFETFVHRDGLADFWDPVLDVQVTNVQHVQRFH